jgi:phosphocarrier protein HPr
MQEISIVVRNKVGLHARPAALFVQIATAHQSKINVIKGDKTGNAKSILGILALGVNQDDRITIQADGADEGEALEKLAKLIEDNFGECR